MLHTFAFLVQVVPLLAQTSPPARPIKKNKTLQNPTPLLSCLTNPQKYPYCWTPEFNLDCSLDWIAPISCLRCTCGELLTPHWSATIHCKCVWLLPKKYPASCILHVPSNALMEALMCPQVASYASMFQLPSYALMCPHVPSCGLMEALIWNPVICSKLPLPPTQRDS